MIARLPLSAPLATALFALVAPFVGAAISPQPVPAGGTRVSILDEASPAAIAILDLATGDFTSVDGERSGRRIVLPVPAGERARAQGLASSGRTSRLWVATDSRLVRIDAASGRPGKSFPMPADATSAAVDVAPFTDAGGERVAVAISPVDAEEMPPGILVFDGATGGLLARYTAIGDEMDLVFALVRDEASGRFVLSNRRLTPAGIKTTLLTGLAWDGTGFSETAEMPIATPAGLPPRSALAAVAPGFAVAATLEIPTATVLDATVPAAWGEHPYLELDPGIEPVALAGTAAITDIWGRPDLFLLDADGSELHRTRGFDGQVTATRSLGSLGLAAIAGSALAVVPAAGAVVVTSPSTGRLAAFDASHLAPRAIAPSPLIRPGAVVVLP